MHENQKKFAQILGNFGQICQNIDTPTPFSPPKPPIQPFGPSTGRWVSLYKGDTVLKLHNKKPPKLTLRGLKCNH